MARKNAAARYASLAACVVDLAELVKQVVLGPKPTEEQFRDRLIAIQEIAYQSVDAKQEQEFGQSMQAIHLYKSSEAGPPPAAAQEQANGQAAQPTESMSAHG